MNASACKVRLMNNVVTRQLFVDDSRMVQRRINVNNIRGSGYYQHLYHDRHHQNFTDVLRPTDSRPITDEYFLHGLPIKYFISFVAFLLDFVSCNNDFSFFL